MAFVRSKCREKPAFLYRICAQEGQFCKVLYISHFGGVISSMIRGFGQAFDVEY